MLIYLASPYSHKNPEVRQQRFYDAGFAVAALMSNNYFVISPICHSHPVAVMHDLPLGFEFWRKQDETLIDRCDVVCVLMLDGWHESEGVVAEIKYAEERGIDVFYIEQEQTFEFYNKKYWLNNCNKYMHKILNNRKSYE